MRGALTGFTKFCHCIGLKSLFNIGQTQDMVAEPQIRHMIGSVRGELV